METHVLPKTLMIAVKTVLLPIAISHGLLTIQQNGTLKTLNVDANHLMMSLQLSSNDHKIYRIKFEIKK